jgi:hypothetical protein
MSLYIAQQARLINSVHMPVDPEPVKFFMSGSMLVFQEGDRRLGISEDNWICEVGADYHPNCHKAIEGPTIP